MHKLHPSRLRLELERQDVDYIVRLLGKQKYKDVAVLMQTIGTQVQAQMVQNAKQPDRK